MAVQSFPPIKATSSAPGRTRHPAIASLNCAPAWPLFVGAICKTKWNYYSDPSLLCWPYHLLRFIRLFLATRPTATTGRPTRITTSATDGVSLRLKIYPIVPIVLHDPWSNCRANVLQFSACSICCSTTTERAGRSTETWALAYPIRNVWPFEARRPACAPAVWASAALVSREISCKQRGPFLLLLLIIWYNWIAISTARKTCQNAIYANNTHFVNEGYPQSYSASGQCTVTVNRLLPQVCQLR